jgi:coenzyme F420 hydrogenase subunit beta
VDWGLCTGCGACYYACTEGGVTLTNIELVGIRPKFEKQCAGCAKCLSICPGCFVDGNLLIGSVKQTEADHEFGPALEIWEGFASDPEIRHKGSSGGIVSALSLFCLEREDMASVLHVGMDSEKPWTSRTVQSHNRKEVLSRAGSRYAPGSPCDGLRFIEESDRPCVFVGKPCDVAAVTRLRMERPELDRKLGLVLTFFCAGTPSSEGTLDLAKSLKVPVSRINSVRYRGEGWPGQFRILYDDGREEQSLSYAESWGQLSNYRPLRCHLCPDGLGRVADISCGDAWEKFENNGDPGRSIVLVRTPRGQEILHRAMAANYVQLKRVDALSVIAAQPNLLQKRKELFGRLLGMKLFMIPVPQFSGFSLFRSWAHLSFTTRLRTSLGTIRRVLARDLWHRRPVFHRSSLLRALPGGEKSR